MESTQNKIYEIEEQEAKPQFKNNMNQINNNDNDIYEKYDYSDKADFGKESANTQPQTNQFNIKTGTNVILLKNPPQFVKDVGDFEPLYPP